MNLKRIVFVGGAVAIAAAVLIGVWSTFLAAVSVKVAQPERNVAVQVFGLGTVEARVTSKIGFKVAGVLVDLTRRCWRPCCQGPSPGPSRRP